MVSLRGAVPLLLTGTSGLALLGFGLTGLSSVDPQLERAARTVQLERSAPDGSAREFVDCPPHRDTSRRPGEV